MNKDESICCYVLCFQQQVERSRFFTNQVNKLLLHKKTGLAVIEQFAELGEEQGNKLSEKSLQQLFKGFIVRDVAFAIIRSKRFLPDFLHMGVQEITLPFYTRCDNRKHKKAHRERLISASRVCFTRLVSSIISVNPNRGFGNRSLLIMPFLQALRCRADNQFVDHHVRRLLNGK